MQGGLEVRGIAGVQKFVEKTFATVEALAGCFPLLFKIGNFIADGLYRLEKSGMRFNRLFVRRIVGYGDAGLSEKLLEESIHGFEAIWIASKPWMLSSRSFSERPASPYPTIRRTKRRLKRIPLFSRRYRPSAMKLPILKSSGKQPASASTVAKVFSTNF